MRRSTGMIIGLALAAAGAAQAQPVPQNHVPRYAAPGEAPQPYVPPGQSQQGQSQQGQSQQGQAPQDFRPAQQFAPQQQQPQFAPAPQGGPPPNFQSWGDDQNGGYFFSSGDPNGPDYYEEEFRRHAVGPEVYQPPVFAQSSAQAFAPPMPCNCGGYGGYEVPTYGYASQNYGWPGQGCCAGGGGEVSYASSSSSWSSGVGGYLADGVWPGGYWPGGGWNGGYWHGGSWTSGDGRFVGVRRSDYDSGWRDLPGRPPVVAPR
jgi:hypothetical protein